MTLPNWCTIVARTLFASIAGLLLLATAIQSSWSTTTDEVGRARVATLRAGTCSEPAVLPPGYGSGKVGASLAIICKSGASLQKGFIDLQLQKHITNQGWVNRARDRYDFDFRGDRNPTTGDDNFVIDDCTPGYWRLQYVFDYTYKTTTGTIVRRLIHTAWTAQKLITCN